MRTLIIFAAFGLAFVPVYSADMNSTKENNTTKEAIKKAVEKEKKFAKEQRFYQADEYDFKGAQVDPNALDKIPSLESDDDFDMSTGVYD